MSITRRLWASAVFAQLAQPHDDTEVIELPARVNDGCRSRHGGQRCGHGLSSHRKPGYGAWATRCVCGCNSYRKPWPHAVLDVGMWLLVLFVLAIVTWLAWRSVA